MICMIQNMSVQLFRFKMCTSNVFFFSVVVKNNNKNYLNVFVTVSVIGFDFCFGAC